MKTINKSQFLFVIFGFIILISSCSKDSSSPSYVDDYVPALNEAAGITYTGDYFPFDEGFSWNWAGTSNVSGSVKAAGYESPISQSGAAVGFMSVNSQTSLTLPSGTYSVFPTSETGGISRYFIKTDSAILIKAIKNPSYDPIEVTDPVYIRKPLIVGQKWYSTPSVDITKQLKQMGYSTSEADLKIKCALFVIGKENFNWNSVNKETVRLDQRAQVTGTISLDIDGVTGTLNVDVKMDMKLLLLKDIGLVNQNGTIVMKLWGPMYSQGIKVNIEMNMTMDQDLTLDTYSLTSPSKIFVTSKTKSNKIKQYSQYSDNAAINEALNNLVNALINAE